MSRTDQSQPASRTRNVSSMLLSAAVGAAVAVAVLWFFPARQSTQGGAVDSEISARLDALENRGQAASPFSSQPNGAQAAGLPSVGGEVAPATLVETELTPAQLKSRNRAMDADFRRQREDPNAPSRELNLLEAMTSPDLAAAGTVPRNPSVDCRQSVCRLTATFRSELDASDWAALYLTSMGPAQGSRMQQAVELQPDGTVRARFYLTN